MENTLSNKYYLQALDAYPWDLPETLESLSYALGYDHEHARAHCLAGRLQMEQMMDYVKAEYHFELALANDMEYILTYELYSLLLIYMKDYNRARKLISHAMNIKGMNIARMIHLEALVEESTGNSAKAKKLIKKALMESIRSTERDFLRSELERLKAKLPKKKKKKKKKKKSRKQKKK